MRLLLTSRASPGNERELEGNSIVIGRSPSCDLVLPDPLLSRRHARLFRRGDLWYVEDLGSRNGTRLDGQLLEGASELSVGNEVEVCDWRIKVLDLADGEAAAEPEGTRRQTVLLRSAKEMAASTDLEDRAPSAVGGDELRKLGERLGIINHFYRRLDAARAAESLLDEMLELLFEHLHADAGAVFLRQTEGEPRLVASRPRERDIAQLLTSRSLVREVMERGMAALVQDLSTDQRYAQARSLADAGLRSFIAAPLSGSESPVGMVVLVLETAGRRFDEDDLRLLTSLAALSASRLRNLELTLEAAEVAEMRRELDAARAIQERLLPKRMPFLKGYELVAMNVPSRGVSGDFYQVVERDSAGECFVLLADVSGKGLAASLLAAILDSFAAEPMAGGEAPEAIFTRLSDLLERRTLPEWFATAFLFVLDRESGRLRYANAGHNPPLLLRDSGDVEQLMRTGLPLGVLPGSEYEKGEAAMEKGDWLILYTDGATEAFNPSKDEYGLERLISVCKRACSRSAVDLLNAITSDLERFSQGEPYADDLTLIALHRLP